MVSLPASAATHLWTRHISAAYIKNGEANYDNAGFERFKIFVVDDDVNAIQVHVDATGTLTLSGGSYTYGDEAVNNTSKTFDLKANMEVGDTLSYKTDNDFIKDAADTGLNGVTATWTFDSMSGLNGSQDIPTFTSTKSQLTTAVPYTKRDRCGVCGGRRSCFMSCLWWGWRPYGIRFFNAKF